MREDKHHAPRLGFLNVIRYALIHLAKQGPKYVQRCAEGLSIRQHLHNRPYMNRRLLHPLMAHVKTRCYLKC